MYGGERLGVGRKQAFAPEPDTADPAVERFDERPL